MQDSGNEQQSAIDPEKLLLLVQKLVKEVHPHFSATQVINLDSTFDKDLGLDSLTRVQLISRVETAFHLSLPERTFAEAETARDLLRALTMAKTPAAIKAVSEIRAVELSEMPGNPVEAQTLVDILDWHIKHHAERVHIQFYEETAEGKQISYQQLKTSAVKVAAGLQTQGLQPGEPVAIMLPTNVDYFYSFFGIILAGGIPVPIYPPARPSQLEDHMRRHSQILINCDTKILITVAEAKRTAQLLKSQVPNLQTILDINDLLLSKFEFIPPALKTADTAFIQYTSGSTGQPKGVVLSHANLLANIRAMGQVVKAGSQDVFVSWLPLYHDMGLIGAWLGSLYYAALFVVMPPLSFLARPERWLWAIHRYRGSLSASPNFGYEYCLRRLSDESLQGLDLSSWRAAFNGAETVSAETIEQFTQRFAAYGFQKNALMPVYGLAESSVGLAFPPINRGPIIDNIVRDVFMQTGKAKPVDQQNKNALRFPSSGAPLPGHQIRIIDQAGHELPERQEGRIQFCGPSSTSGYYRNAEKTRELFFDKWLDTGDLGYIASGELYVTGRIKDIIIRAGRNIYPHELEEAVGNIKGIRAGRVAVFGSQDKQSGTEQLIVLAETRTSDETEKDKLRQTINTLSADLTGAPPDQIILAPPNTVLKTSSGKIRRAACKELYESNKIGRPSTNVIWQISRLTIASIKPQLRRSLRYAKDWLFAAYAWSCYGILAPIVWLTAVYSSNFSRRWHVMSHCARLLAKFTRTPLTINGLENFPAPGKPCIIVANHTSYLDSYSLVALLPGHFRFLAKMELAKDFSTRKPLQNIHTEFVERDDPEKSVTESKRLAQLLKQGENLMFFAEGTFSRIPGLKQFHLGAFTLAAEADVPVVPVTIRGTRSILRGDSWFPHHGAIHLEIGQPIYPAQFKEETQADNWNTAIALRNQAREFILQHCGEPDLSQ